MTIPRHLVIFARFPQAGAGKRRLAKGIGVVEALRFQRVRLAVLINRHSRDPRWTTWLAVTPDRSHPWPSHVRIVRQGRGDLGQRMGRVMTALPAGRVVIVGTDIPGISAAAIVRAFNALGRHDAVFGPAGDGGYWLIGLKRTPKLRLPFAGVRWSSAHTLADTEHQLRGARIAHVDRLDDVDDAASWRDQPRWARMCAAQYPTCLNNFASRKAGIQ